MSSMTQYILSNSEMAQADLITIKDGLTSIQLMKNAGKAVFKNLPIIQQGKVLILCGPGNNGGDGFVISNLLTNWRKCFEDEKYFLSLFS